MAYNLKKLLSHIILSGFLLSLMLSCYEEVSITDTYQPTPTLDRLDGSPIFYDSINNLALVGLTDFGEVSGPFGLNLSDSLLLNSELYTNNEVVQLENIDKDTRLSINCFDKYGNSNIYNLQFTRLPIFHIQHTYKKIPDEPKIQGTITMFFPDANIFLKDVFKIEQRGGSSRAFPKKSYGFQFYSDTNSNDLAKHAGLLEGEDWILDAAYMDKSMVRNRFSFDVWEKIQAGSDRFVLRSSVGSTPVELFINYEYVGVYWLGEKLDAERLQQQNVGISDQFLMYKSEKWSEITRFEALADTARNSDDWEGWEFEATAYRQKINWSPLYNLVELVTEGSDSLFAERIDALLNIDQAIDYFIFMNLINGNDNAGKNIYLVLPDFDSAFYMCPWDLDATWGRNWKAEPIVGDKIVSFQLFQRLMQVNPDNFKNRLKARWLLLRQETLSVDELRKIYIANISGISSSGADIREQEKWPESMYNMLAEKEYVLDWMEKRMVVLDEYFELQ